MRARQLAILVPATMIFGIGLASCEGRQGEADARLAKLERQVSDLSTQVYLDRDRITRLMAEKASNAVATASGVELVVTWPGRSGADYRHMYSDQVGCEHARQAVFLENGRREAENQAQVGHNGVVAVGQVEKATAVCIPQ